MQFRRVFLPVVLVLAFSGQSFGASIFEHAERTFLDAFDTTGLVILAVGVAGTAVAANNDVAMYQFWGNNQRMPTNFSAIGDFWGGGGAIIPIVGQLFFDTQNGIVSAEGQVESFIIAEGLKYGVARPRPCAVENCVGGADNESFPSGHTTSAFSFASSMGAEYPWYIYVPSYAMGVYTGLSRIADNQHWLSDVVAGATLGMLFGRAGYKHHLGLHPLVINDGGDGFGLVATWRF